MEATASEVDQRPLVEALLRPGALEPEHAGAAELRESHISWLFFTRRHVYKLKKPVDYGFLDFTTVERRRTACHEELRLNRRMSPRVYLGVRRVVENVSGVRLAPDVDSSSGGRVLDHVVQMRRLPEEGWLPRALARGEVDTRVALRLGHRIADFHAAAERSAEITGIGAWETVRDNVEENFAQTRSAVGTTLDAATHDVVRAYARSFLRGRKEWFRVREREQRVCDGHGDLHLAQICLVDDAIEIIDCIEFNRRFRCADVAADLAFTVMDLEFFDRPDLATALMDAYVERSGDIGLRDLLPFYACYRAYTRGKIESLRSEQLAHETPPHGRGLEARAARYFALARTYATLPGPLLLITCGLMGTGKSTLTRALEERLDGVRLSSDRLRKRLAGVEESRRCRVPWGTGIYDDAHTSATYDELHQRTGALLHAGCRVIVDAAYATAAQRAAAREVARRADAPMLLLHVQCEERSRFERLERRASEQTASDGRVTLARQQKKHFEAPARERPDRIGVSTEGDGCLEALTAVYEAVLSA